MARVIEYTGAMQHRKVIRACSRSASSVWGMGGIRCGAMAGDSIMGGGTSRVVSGQGGDIRVAQVLEHIGSVTVMLLRPQKKSDAELFQETVEAAACGDGPEGSSAARVETSGLNKCVDKVEVGTVVMQDKMSWRS